MSTKISIATLALFASKFSYDARDIKDFQIKNYSEQKKLNLQWMGIFKHLPVGVLITKENKVIHANQKMLTILGRKDIKVSYYLIGQAIFIFSD